MDIKTTVKSLLFHHSLEKNHTVALNTHFTDFLKPDDLEMPLLKNNVGRKYERGKPLSEDFRRIIMDELEQKLSGNKENITDAHVAFAEVSRVFRVSKSNRNAMNRNWSNQKSNPALKTKAGYK